MHRAALSILRKVNHKGAVGTSSYGSRYLQHDAGFSLVEVVTVVLMVGILAAIALPSWSAFVTRQRLNKANDAVLAAIQQAQREAKKQKINYSVSFRTDSNVVQTAVYSTPSPSNWQSLGGDLQIPAGAISLSTNIASPNQVGSSSSTPTITFDYLGSLPNANLGAIQTGSTEQPGLKIVVASSNSGNSANSVKRCVIVKTILGGTVTAKDTDCN
ncbi:hypothetical protein NIES4074_42210 [Cylindrospermum sp. NIES-4074]|nr:hypothetical protein NIES4074_42210 [Cylindrospermum sp. NIES-4074]